MTTSKLQLEAFLAAMTAMWEKAANDPAVTPDSYMWFRQNVPNVLDFYEIEPTMALRLKQ